MTYSTEDIFIAMILMTEFLYGIGELPTAEIRQWNPVNETSTLCLPRGYWAVTFIGDC